MKRIAIWAPLRYANYGDDLQAIILGKTIKSIGYEVILFQLNPTLSHIYGLESANSEEELLREADACVIAGGSFLMPINPIKRYLHPHYRAIENDYIRLYKSSKKLGIKILPISIGGDGYIHKAFWQIPLSRLKFLKSPMMLNGTVRLFEDVAVMKHIGKQFLHYPDMLLQVGNMINFDNCKFNDKIRIGFNLKKGKYLDKKLVEDIFYYSNHYDDLEFFFIKSHMDISNINYEYLPLKSSKNIHIVKYEDPYQLLGLLASLNCIISSKLHLGLTALAIGTPFISYRGQGKTIAFLQSINAEWAIKKDISFKEFRTDVLAKTKQELLLQYDNNKLSKMIDESLGHYDFCLNSLKSLFG